MATRTADDIMAAVMKKKASVADPALTRKDFWDSNAPVSPVKTIYPEQAPAPKPKAGARETTPQSRKVAKAAQAVVSKKAPPAARNRATINDFLSTPRAEGSNVQPNRAGAKFTPGSKADRAYTGVSEPRPLGKIKPTDRLVRDMKPAPEIRPKPKGGRFAALSMAAHGLVGAFQGSKRKSDEK